LDTGADLSVIKSSSLQPGIKYSLKDGINIKGIPNNYENRRDHNTEIIQTHTKPHTHFMLLETNLESNMMAL